MIKIFSPENLFSDSTHKSTVFEPAQVKSFLHKNNLRRFIPTAETRDFHAASLLKLWTLKESYGKFLGYSLSKELLRNNFVSVNAEEIEPL